MSNACLCGALSRGTMEALLPHVRALSPAIGLLALSCRCLVLRSCNILSLAVRSRDIESCERVL